MRWPTGKDSSGGRYAVIGISHTAAKSYRNSSIRFKLRHADPFDFKSSAGEVTQEIILKMSGIISEFRVCSLSVQAITFLFLFLLYNFRCHCMIDDTHDVTPHHIVVLLSS